MTAEPHTRRTVLTTGAAVAGAAVGTVALAACGSDMGGQPSSNGNQAQAPAPAAGGPLAKLDDVPVGQAKAVTTPDGKDAIVARPTAGTVAAFSAICTHQGCKVAPAGAELKCPCHGSVFDAMTGQVKHGPATRNLPAMAVKVENGQVVSA
jgi:Rieske Fe-S protein